MNEPDISHGLAGAVVHSLGVGVAVADARTWEVRFANQAFTNWFPPTSGDDDLSARLHDLKEDRARKRLEKGRSFSFESEIKVGARAIALKTTLRQVDRTGESFLLVETVDLTKQKEQEYMLDSFAQLADRNKRQLEAANRALEEKREELEKAYHLIKAQKDRMERELNVARQVQMSMLPMDFSPNRDECTVAATLKPALEVGGDFFDLFFVDSHRLCLSVGDVSDKGAPSALFMAAAKTLLKSHATRAESTAGIVGRVNRELAVNNESCMFVTLFLAILNLETGELIFTNGGHNPPYLMRKGHTPERLSQRNGPALGVVPLANYTEDRIVLESGDLLVAYTDGVTEAMNDAKEFFGDARLETTLSADHVNSAEEAVRSLADAVTAFEDGAPQFDDTTILAVKFHGPAT